MVVATHRANGWKIFTSVKYPTQTWKMEVKIFYPGDANWDELGGRRERTYERARNRTQGKASKTFDQ